MILVLISSYPNGEVRAEIENECGSSTINLTTKLSGSGDLDKLLEEHAGEYAYWAAVQAQAEDAKDTAEVELDRVDGELWERYRLECKAEGITATGSEKVIKSRIEQSVRHQKAVEGYNVAKSTVRAAAVGVRAYEQRRGMLEKLAERERKTGINERMIESSRRLVGA